MEALSVIKFRRICTKIENLIKELGLPFVCGVKHEGYMHIADSEGVIGSYFTHFEINADEIWVLPGDSSYKPYHKKRRLYVEVHLETTNWQTITNALDNAFTSNSQNQYYKYLNTRYTAYRRNGISFPLSYSDSNLDNVLAELLELDKICGSELREKIKERGL